MFRSLKTFVVFAGLVATASAETLLTQDQALKVIFPRSESAKAEAKSLSPDQRKTLEEDTGLRFPESEYPTFVATSKSRVDGYAVFRMEMGKHEKIPFFGGFPQRGKGRDVAVMEYRE